MNAKKLFVVVSTFIFINTTSVFAYDIRIKSDLTQDQFDDIKNIVVKTEVFRGNKNRNIKYVQHIVEKRGQKTQGRYSANPDKSLSVENQLQTGYILLPPNPKFIRAKRNNGNIKITWHQILGAIRYEIYVSDSASGTFSPLSFVDGSGSGPFEYIHSGIGQGSIFYKIKSTGIDLNGNEFDTLLLSSYPVETLPAKVTNVQASDNVYHTEAKGGNSNNVYPIKIEWDSAQDTGGKSYSVWRATSTNTSNPPAADDYFQIVTGITGLYFYDNAEFMRSGNYLYYKVCAYNSVGGAGDISDADRGYGTLKNIQFVEEFQSVIIAAYNTLTRIQKKGLGALGSETESGAVSGTVYYKAKVNKNLRGGVAIMEFTNYAHKTDAEDSSIPYLLVNGTNHTAANLRANGIYTSRYMLEGMYTGVITAALKVTRGLISGGAYTVTQDSRVPVGDVGALDVTQP